MSRKCSSSRSSKVYEGVCQFWVSGWAEDCKLWEWTEGDGVGEPSKFNYDAAKY